MREQKKLGRLIKNFEESQRMEFRALIVYRGNTQKFIQNPNLSETPLQTQGTSLVESAPDDTIWGIGLAKDDPEHGKGKNLARQKPTR